MRTLSAAIRHLALAFVAMWMGLAAPIAQAQSTNPNYTALWWNAAESGWGLNVVHQGDILFVTQFTYQKAGLGTQNPGTWFVGSRLDKQPDGSYLGAWYQTVGPAFDANPFTPLTAAQNTQVGTIRLTFSSDSGTMTYTVNGSSVTKALTKMVYGVAAAACSFTDNPDRSASTNYQDLWWNVSESGWGVNFTHQYTQDRGEIIFATMFNYQKAGLGLNNPPTWFVASAMVKQADGSFLGEYYRTTGSAFDANPFVPLTAANMNQVGTMRFTPINGQTGTLTYSVDGVTVVKNVTRMVYQYPVSSCTTVIQAVPKKLLLSIAAPSQNNQNSLMVIDLASGQLSSAGISSSTSASPRALGCGVGNLRSDGIARIACTIGTSHWDFNPVTGVAMPNSALANLPTTTVGTVVSSPTGTDYYGVGANQGGGQVLVRNGNSYAGAIDISSKVLQYVHTLLGDFPAGKLYTLNQNITQYNNPATLPANVDRIDISTSKVDATYTDTVPGIGLALYNGGLYMAKHRDANGMDVVKLNASTFQKTGEAATVGTSGSGGVQFVYSIAVDANGVHLGVYGGIQTLSHDLKTVIRTSTATGTGLDIFPYNGKLYVIGYVVADGTTYNVFEVDSATGSVLRRWSVNGNPNRPVVVGN